MNFRNNILLVAVAAVLLLVLPLIVLVSHRAANPTETSIAITPSVEVVIQKLLARYQVNEKSIRTQKVPSGDGKFIRIERRVFVAPEFNTMSFNHDLNKTVTGLGATVIATERSEDKAVTMHVKKNGIIVETIVFVVKKDL